MANLRSGTNIGGALALFDGVNNPTLNGNVYIGNSSGSPAGILNLYGTTPGTLSIIKTTNGNLHIDCNTSSTTYINYYSGTGGIVFGNGAGAGSGASVSSGGVITASSFSGNVSGTASGNWPNEGAWKPSSLSSQTRLRGITSPDGGEFATAYGSGKIYPYCDGLFFQNEGAYQCLDTQYNSSLPSDSRNSRGVTRLYRYDSDSDYSVQVHYDGRWYLRGFNGDTYHGECKVDYATYAASAGSAPANGGNADSVDGQHFAWSNSSNSPTYLWSADSNGSAYLAARGSISVNYANSAGSAPASDVYAWAKAATKPSYTASEVGAITGAGIAKITVGTSVSGTPATGDLWVDTN